MASYNTVNEFFESNKSKIGNLKTKFEGYLVQITKVRIETYLCQFALNHKAIALKLLENVDYYSNARASQLANRLGGLIKKAANKKLDEVYFCPIDSSSGSSTDTIIRKIRNELHLDSSRYDDKFIHVSDLENFILGPQVQISNLRDRIRHIESLPDDSISSIERQAQISDLESQIRMLQGALDITKPRTIVFVDDFIGSGNSFIEFWGSIGAYLNDHDKYILATLVAHQQGIDMIKDNITIKILTAIKPIPYSCKIFHPKNKTFSEEEKNVLKSYCDKMGFTNENRYGFMDTQSSVIFYERSSNNTLPILYSDKNNWIPLFPRNV